MATGIAQKSCKALFPLWSPREDDQGSIITIKLLYVITLHAKILAYMTYIGKYQKAYIQHHNFYPVIFLTVFPKLILI